MTFDTKLRCVSITARRKRCTARVDVQEQRGAFRLPCLLGKRLVSALGRQDSPRADVARHAQDVALAQLPVRGDHDGAQRHGRKVRGAPLRLVLGVEQDAVAFVDVQGVHARGRFLDVSLQLVVGQAHPLAAALHLQGDGLRRTVGGTGEQVGDSPHRHAAALVQLLVGQVQDVALQAGDVDVADVVAPIDAARVEAELPLLLGRQRVPQRLRVGRLVARLDVCVRAIDVHVVEQQVELGALDAQSAAHAVDLADE
jgi:hypothetical protein